MEKQIIRWMLKIIIFICLIVLTILFASFGIFLFIVMKKKDDLKVKDEVQSYQLLNYDPETKEIFRGFTTGDNSLEENQFVTYENRKGKHFLISNFGSNEFRCTGICYCEKRNDDYDDRRSTTATRLSRNILYLVAATSSLLAANIARNHFSELCTREAQYFEELDCNEHDHVLSELEDCEELSQEKYVDFLLDNFLEKDEEKEEEEGDKVFGKGKYLCKGNCHPNTNEFFPGYKPNYATTYVQALVRSGNPNPVDFSEFKKQSESFGCEEMKFEKTVEVFDLDVARKLFQIHLHSFCMENSRNKVFEVRGCVNSEELSKEQEEKLLDWVDDESLRESCDGNAGGKKCKGSDCKFYWVKENAKIPLCCGYGKYDPEILSITDIGTDGVVLPRENPSLKCRLSHQEKGWEKKKESYKF